MLSLEEYIEKRKTEDGINEFDVLLTTLIISAKP